MVAEEDRSRNVLIFGLKEDAGETSVIKFAMCLNKWQRSYTSKLFEVGISK